MLSSVEYQVRKIVLVIAVVPLLVSTLTTLLHCYCVSPLLRGGGEWGSSEVKGALKAHVVEATNRVTNKMNIFTKVLVYLQMTFHQSLQP